MAALIQKYGSVVHLSHLHSCLELTVSPLGGNSHSKAGAINNNSKKVSKMQINSTKSKCGNNKKDMPGGQKVPLQSRKMTQLCRSGEVLQSSAHDVKTGEKQLFTTFVSSRQEGSSLGFRTEQV